MAASTAFRHERHPQRKVRPYTEKGSLSDTSNAPSVTPTPQISLRDLNHIVRRPPMRRLKGLLPIPQPHIRPPLPNKRCQHNCSQRYSQGHMHRLVSSSSPAGHHVGSPLVSPIARSYAAVLRLLHSLSLNGTHPNIPPIPPRLQPSCYLTSLRQGFPCPYSVSAIRYLHQIGSRSRSTHARSALAEDKLTAEDKPYRRSQINGHGRGSTRPGHHRATEAIPTWSAKQGKHFITAEEHSLIPQTVPASPSRRLSA